MQDSKIRKIFSAVTLILILIIYTFYRMYHTGETSVTIGVDDSKIGIVADSEKPIFINLEDIQKVEIVDDYNTIDGSDYTLCANENLGVFIIVTTPDMVYIINTSTQNATEKIYKDITDAISE